MKQLIIVSTVWATLFIGVDCPAADEETRKFLDATAAAVSTAMGRLQCGEIDFEYVSIVRGNANLVSSRRGGGKHPGMPYRSTVKSQGTLVWQDDSRYAKFNLEEAVTEHPGEEGEITKSSRSNGSVEFIRSPHLVAQYHEAANVCVRKTVQANRGLGKRYLEALDLQVTWFCTVKHPKFNHGTLISWPYDDSALQEAEVENVKRYPRRRSIVLNSYGVIHEYVVDLDQGGMVIEGRYVAPQNEGSYKESTWSWDRDEHGVWYVTRWTHAEYDTDDPDEASPNTLTFTEQGVVKRFNSRPEIPKDRFKFSSLDLPKGTRIMHLTASGTSYSHVGGKPPEQKKFELDSLIDDVQDGFAAP